MRGVLCLVKILMMQQQALLVDQKQIIDEYGRYYAIKEFCDMLDGCPIQFTNSVGTEFS